MKLSVPVILGRKSFQLIIWFNIRQLIPDFLQNFLQPFQIRF